MDENAGISRRNFIAAGVVGAIGVALPGVTGIGRAAPDDFARLDGPNTATTSRFGFAGPATNIRSAGLGLLQLCDFQGNPTVKVLITAQTQILRKSRAARFAQFEEGDELLVHGSERAVDRLFVADIVVEVSTRNLAPDRFA